MRTTGAGTSTAAEGALLAAARGGDEDAFARLVAPYRAELHAHCYRMLGSVHDAEDAVQETTLRAWRGLAGFEGRSALRSWLYTIATNTSLNLIAKRPKRVLPIDQGPATEPDAGLGLPLAETVWIEADPDATSGAAAPAPRAGPGAAAGRDRVDRAVPRRDDRARRRLRRARRALRAARERR